MPKTITITLTDEEAQAADREFGSVAPDARAEYPNGVDDYLTTMLRHTVLGPIVLREGAYATAAIVDRVQKLDAETRAQVEALIASKDAAAPAPEGGKS